MAFEFKRHLIKVQGGRTDLPVSARIVWFREEHPDWSIETEAVEINHEKQYAIFRARICDGDGKLMGTGTKKEDVKGFGDYIEKAECVPLDTRILTAEGWKLHDELRLGEPVLGYNAEQDRLEWVPLLAVRRYQDAPVVRASNGKGFDVVCTPDHKWAVRYSVLNGSKKYVYRKMRETSQFTKVDAIMVGAVAPSGLLDVTPQQAFLMGMLITDGCVRYDGKHIRGYICQSKDRGVEAIREQLAGVPHQESVTPAHARTFPTGRTYDCRLGYRWNIAAGYLHDLHDAFGIVHETELSNTVAGLSQEARTAMLDAMMLADGDKQGNFAQMPGRNDWVIDVWTALCALEGSMVCKAKVRETCGGIWVARRKKTRSVWASSVVVEDAGTDDVWCPQTPLGTWVARFGNDVVTVTGNTGSVGRALALCGFGTQFSPELDESSAGRFADSPQPMGGGRFSGGGGGGNYNGGNGGGNNGGPNGGGSGGGSNRYGSPPPTGDGVRFTPPREASPPREMNAPSAERPVPVREAPRNDATRNNDAPRAEAPRAEAPRNEAPRNEAPRNEAPRPEPTRPAPARPAPVDDAGEDDFEALIGGEGLLDATEDDPFGDDAEAAPKVPAATARPAAPAKPEAASGGNPACIGCGKALTRAQQELSIRNYGEALCPGCQRDKTRRPALAERA